MKSSFDRYLQDQLKKPKVRKAFEEERKVLRIGLALAEARKKKGLSQREMARRLGTSAPQISRTERRPEHSTVQTLEKYAHAVGMELDFRLVAKPQA
jgi:ribosome-binding protein aMBF1 (putative translation factor)